MACILWWTVGIVGFRVATGGGWLRVSSVGVAHRLLAAYDPGMIIETARDLHAWCLESAAAALSGLDPADAEHAAQCIESVVWRHAIGQGLRLGDDWGWVLSMYGDAQFREIVQAAAESAAADRSRRRRWGY